MSTLQEILPHRVGPCMSIIFGTALEEPLLDRMLWHQRVSNHHESAQSKEEQASYLEPASAKVLRSKALCVAFCVAVSVRMLYIHTLW